MLHQFPSLGTVVREPIRMSGGLVFGRPLIECVRDTRYEGAVSSAQETGSFYVPSLLEDRMIPSLIFRCVKHLQLWGIEEEGVFRISGRASHIQKLKAEFDSGADYDLSECSPSELDPHAVASIFKTYFRELPETILTRPLSGSFDLIMSMEKRINPLSQSSSSLRRVVQRSPSGSTLSSHSLTPSNSNPDDLTLALSALIYRLPRENRDLLKTLTELITETASKSAINKMHLDNLLLIFCPTLGMKPALLRLLCQNEQIWVYTEPDQSNQTLHRAASSSSDAAHHDVEAQADSDNTLSESSSARSLHDSIQEDESSGEIGSYGPHLRARRTHGRRVPVPAMLAEDVVPDSVSLLDEVLSESSHQSHESQVSSTYPLSTNSAGSPVHPTVREPVDAQSSESANLNIPPPSPSEGASVYHSEDHTLHVQIPDTTPPAVNLELESSRPVTLYLDPCTEIPSLPSSPISPISPPTPTLPKARLIDRSSFKKRLSFLQITPAENSSSSPHSPKTGSSQDDLKSPSSIHSGPSTPSGLHHALSFPFLRSSKTAPLSASPLASSPASEGRRLSRRSSLGMFFGKRNNSELEAIVDHSSLTSGARIGPLPPFLTLPLESPGLRIGFGIDENVAEDSHGYTDVPALPQEPTILDQKQVHSQGSVSDVPSSTARDLTLSVPQATSKAPRIALQTYSPLESNWAESVLSATHSHS
ncbi:RhoGAP-domain-containing protein [Sistotremastrum niveocremeum HHB9708]|uniref:RhoGAP-domain-containing protein n=1 Tax=Sistotremastrum niveocremeum HHB9708 TaxID=1314777 RepID=A0A165A3B7_9AGAM|nr:RhoGAP-domain-containing protein [Sistotremastrum niveocremeum HHB9708]